MTEAMLDRLAGGADLAGGAADPDGDGLDDK